MRDGPRCRRPRSGPARPLSGVRRGSSSSSFFVMSGRRRTVARSRSSAHRTHMSRSARAAISAPAGSPGSCPTKSGPSSRRSRSTRRWRSTAVWLRRSTSRAATSSSGRLEPRQQDPLSVAEPSNTAAATVASATSAAGSSGAGSATRSSVSTFRLPLTWRRVEDDGCGISAAPWSAPVEPDHFAVEHGGLDDRGHTERSLCPVPVLSLWLFLPVGMGRTDVVALPGAARPAAAGWIPAAWSGGASREMRETMNR